MKMKSCPECGSTELKYDEDGLVCAKCGTIIEENYYSGGKVV